MHGPNLTSPSTLQPMELIPTRASGHFQSRVFGPAGAHVSRQRIREAGGANKFNRASFWGNAREIIWGYDLRITVSTTLTTFRMLSVGHLLELPSALSWPTSSATAGSCHDAAVLQLSVKKSLLTRLHLRNFTVHGEAFLYGCRKIIKEGCKDNPGTFSGTTIQRVPDPFRKLKPLHFEPFPEQNRPEFARSPLPTLFAFEIWNSELYSQQHLAKEPRRLL